MLIRRRAVPLVERRRARRRREQPTRFTLDTPEAQGCWQEFFSLRTVFGVIPSDQEVEAEDDESRFANGRLAMLLSIRGARYRCSETIANFDWDVASLPLLRRAGGILHSDAYCLTSDSKAKDAAWRFVEFALGAEGHR